MTAPKVTVRPATADDLEAVAEIYAHYVHHSTVTFDLVPPTVDDWRRKHGEVTARGLPFLIADHGSEVVGFAYLAPWRAKPAYRHTAEDTIYLAPTATGRGTGAALLEALLALADSSGIRQTIAVITEDGEGSLVLHRRFGFTEAGRLEAVGYKHERWIGTILMQRPLPG
ncbi:N-acetyltransferase [Actinosynnema pretiosum subsp. pretiosum]|uniref:N-acetyltransferase n=1 Tax=Actinosynnema pretiosum subsp. pretiosum TaxID=103721 RepID=A0AA45L7K7_9PSEU|nr:GCN5-related N-acetyltransferase [Actinosynnema pretiosum subsp. pretiosum]QUF04538.1 N-acetyltransferase [Actinosynnema pretiosum subsp. pretiosum]